jgi:hypothetical protein
MPEQVHDFTRGALFLPDFDGLVVVGGGVVHLTIAQSHQRFDTFYHQEALLLFRH